MVGLSINPMHYNTLHDILFKSNKYKITIYRDMFTLNTYRQDDFFELVTFFFHFCFFKEWAWDAIGNNVSSLNH